jgi:hypothetical protein
MHPRRALFHQVLVMLVRSEPPALRAPPRYTPDAPRYQVNRPRLRKSAWDKRNSHPEISLDIPGARLDDLSDHPQLGGNAHWPPLGCDPAGFFVPL